MSAPASSSPWGTPIPAWPTGERTQFAVVNGYPFAYVEAGARLPALVLVHGSMSDLRAFQLQVPALARTARTFSLIQRGTVASSSILAALPGRNRDVERIATR